MASRFSQGVKIALIVGLVKVEKIIRAAGITGLG